MAELFALGLAGVIAVLIGATAIHGFQRRPSGRILHSVSSVDSERQRLSKFLTHMLQAPAAVIADYEDSTSAALCKLRRASRLATAPWSIATATRLAEFLKDGIKTARRSEFVSRQNLEFLEPIAAALSLLHERRDLEAEVVARLEVCEGLLNVILEQFTPFGDQEKFLQRVEYLILWARPAGSGDRGAARW